MNEKHHLDAPNSDSLENIVQIHPHDELSSLYPEAKKGWSGEIMSEERRQSARDTQIEAYQTSIQRRWVTIGLLMAAPLIVAAVGGAVFLQHIVPMNTTNQALTIIPALIIAATILGVLYGCTKKLLELFYQHSLRLGPILVITWTLLGLSAQTIFLLTLPLHKADPTGAALIVSGIAIPVSLLLSALLLRLWVSPKLTSSAKLSSIALIALIILAASAGSNLYRIFFAN